MFPVPGSVGFFVQEQTDMRPWYRRQRLNHAETLSEVEPPDG
jgi:hypothetical protein